MKDETALLENPVPRNCALILTNISIRQLWFGKVLHAPKTIQVDISLGCPPELDDKILLLTTQHTLDVRYKETKQDQHSVLLPFCPAFIMLQVVTQLVVEKRHQWSYVAMNPTM